MTLHKRLLHLGISYAYGIIIAVVNNNFLRDAEPHKGVRQELCRPDRAESARSPECTKFRLDEGFRDCLGGN